MAGIEDGGGFEIIVDGKTRSFRDEREAAIEAGEYLKDQYRQSQICVKDTRSNFSTVISWESGTAFIRLETK